MKLAAFARPSPRCRSSPSRPRRRCRAPAPASQKIAIDARGPLALVEVTRTVVPEPAEGGGGNEALLDLALPDASALVSVEVRDGGRWRSVDAAAEGSGRAPPRPTAPRAPPAA